MDAGQARRFASAALGAAALWCIFRAWVRWELRHDWVSVAIGAVLAVACVLVAVASWEPRRW